MITVDDLRFLSMMLTILIVPASLLFTILIIKENKKTKALEAHRFNRALAKETLYRKASTGEFDLNRVERELRKLRAV